MRTHRENRRPGTYHYRTWEGREKGSTESITSRVDLRLPRKLAQVGGSRGWRQQSQAHRICWQSWGFQMVRLTLIARVTDGLPLAEGMDDGRGEKDLDVYKQQARALFKKLTQGTHEPSRMSIETGPYFFHYIIEGGVCYLTLCERAYPKKLAFQYLEELQREFEKVNRSQIETVARPYAFVKFDAFIQKTRRLYLDTRTQRNLSKLNDDLYEVQQIMTRNIQDVLGIGDRLDQATQLSNKLTRESKVFEIKAKDLNRQALIKKWAPVAIVLGIVLLLLLSRRYFWG